MYPPPSINTMANIRWTEHVASLGVKRSKCKVLSGNGKRPGHVWEK